MSTKKINEVWHTSNREMGGDGSSSVVEGYMVKGENGFNLNMLHFYKQKAEYRYLGGAITWDGDESTPSVVIGTTTYYRVADTIANGFLRGSAYSTSDGENFVANVVLVGSNYTSFYDGTSYSFYFINVPEDYEEAGETVPAGIYVTKDTAYISSIVPKETYAEYGDEVTPLEPSRLYFDKETNALYSYKKFLDYKTEYADVVKQFETISDFYYYYKVNTDTLKDDDVQSLIGATVHYQPTGASETTYVVTENDIYKERYGYKIGQGMAANPSLRADVVYVPKDDAEFTEKHSAGFYFSQYAQGGNVVVEAVEYVIEKETVVGEIDTTPTANSSNLVTSGGVKTALDGKADKVSVASSIPQGGLLPNVLYNVGTLEGSVTIDLAAPADSTVLNLYHICFATGTTAPSITWGSAITSWMGGSAPTINASKHYEVSVLNGVGVAMEV